MARTTTVICLLGMGICVGLGAANKPTAKPPQGQATVTHVADFGAVPNDGKDDTKAVNAAIAACKGSQTRMLHFSGGTFDLSHITFPPTISVVIPNGTVLNVTDGAIARFDGPFSAGLHQVFSGRGRTQFGAGAVGEVYPQWWAPRPRHRTAARPSTRRSTPLRLFPVSTSGCPARSTARRPSTSTGIG